MSESTQTYTVEIDPRKGVEGRRRAGFAFERLSPQTLELTKDQVEAFENDPYFIIREGAGEEGDADSSEEAVEQPAATEAEVNTEAEAPAEEVEAPSVVEETSVEEANPKDELVKKNRKELNAIAAEAGVEGAEELETKADVADAILAINTKE